MWEPWLTSRKEPELGGAWTSGGIWGPQGAGPTRFMQHSK